MAASGDTDAVESHGAAAVLFPWLVSVIGIFAYYLISRYARRLPYTAVMFIVGALLGWFAQSSGGGDSVMASIRLWLTINGEVILLVFLPGLLFLDSFKTNGYLFRRAFTQLVTFAFPMVLAGTAATAYVARWLYGWTLDLGMTFGSILSATDPVAVAVLLNSLGAPSRLKIHISGESLLNDGSAVVFFNIFSSRFFYELGIEGFGEDIGWLRGFALFFRLSLGGACIGILFGLGLVALLYNLNRRLSQEENVIQVTATITVAYLSFFVSEVICHCSGIISVVFCGLTGKAFGETLLNDIHLTHDFWHITEHLLNSVLFTLGGAVWGGFISSMDWTSLLIVYACVLVIRFVLLLVFFPVTSNIGIGQSWREAAFMGFGGLRGAVGIALALLLSAQVFRYTESDNVPEETRVQYREYTATLFSVTGGVSFLSLLINGTTSGFVLNALGLVTPTQAREKVVSNYVAHMVQGTLEELLLLLSEKRFEMVDFWVIREHVSSLREITSDDLQIAIESFQRKYPDKVPNLSSIESYVASQEGKVERRLVRADPASRLLRNGSSNGAGTRQTVYDFSAMLNQGDVAENRAIFLELLRREYHRQLESGELDSRGFIPHCLLRSLEISDEAASRGLPLNDWAASQTAGNKIVKKGDRALHAYRVGGLFNRQDARDEDFHEIRSRVLLALSFLSAHAKAEETFKAEFASINENSLTLAEKAVLDESRDQVSKAEAAINAFDVDDVNAVKSQYVCGLLLHKSANFFRRLAASGLLTEREAGEMLESFDLELRQLRISSELKSQARWSGRKISPELAD